MARALGVRKFYSVKIDQGGGELDQERLDEFIAGKTFFGKHVLFVDSTVDSGRQIKVLERYFETETFKVSLGHKSWSIIGSNENGVDLPHHKNFDWGVDPDSTFEDKPDFMGIDYDHGSRTKIVECPTKISETIRRCIVAVPNGWIYSQRNIYRQIETQRKQWAEKQRQNRAEYEASARKAKEQYKKEVREYREGAKKQRIVEKVEDRHARIVASRHWRNLVAAHSAPLEEMLPNKIKNGSANGFHNILIIGHSRPDLPESSVRFVAENLGQHCSLFSGTGQGNPGRILHRLMESETVKTPEARLYQPNYRKGGQQTFNGIPIRFVGDRKNEMRIQMILDADKVLALCGESGTLREILLALALKKPTVVIEKYGPVSEYVAGNKLLRRNKHLTVCKTLVEAVETILHS